jgi:hypothetical protein
MQIANGFVTTCPEISHYVYGITPAEAVILKTMHQAYSNGTPLKQLVIVGEATEVDQYGKPLMIGEKKPFKRIIASMDSDGNPTMKPVADFEMSYTPSTKPRTQAEEMNRLRRKYIGNVTVNGKTISAWEAAFGNGSMIHLPETFEEVLHVIGPVFSMAPEASKTETTTNAEPHGENAPEAPSKRIGRPPKVQEQTANA